MSIERRQILKMIALSPLLSVAELGQTALGQILDECSAGHDVSILLHGFFFIEFHDNNLLVAASPKIDGHYFRYRDHDQKKDLGVLDTPVDWTKQLNGDPSRTRTFPPELLHFSRKDIHLTDKTFIDANPLDGSGQPQYGCHIRLPYPKNIVPIRFGGNINDKDFEMGPPNGNVMQSIKKGSPGSPGRLSLITCLQYDVKPGSNLPFRIRNYYAEHCKIPDVTEMGHMLDTVRAVFTKKFDLTITKIPQSGPPPGPNDDERALSELPHKMENNPCKEEQQKIIHTANCPQFGITPA